MQTGDIVLFSDTTFLPSRVIEFASQSMYSHIGIILNGDDCKLLQSIPNLLKGKTYILESTGFSDIPDAEDNKIKWGVQIRDFEKVKDEYNGRVFHRSLKCTRDENFYNTLQKVHSFVHGKSYNTSPLEWFDLLIGKDYGNESESNEAHELSSFVCSTLVAYIYKNLELIAFGKERDFSIVRPKDFGSENFTNDTRRINFTNCILDEEVRIK
jgi:hypothetical protein